MPSHRAAIFPGIQLHSRHLRDSNFRLSNRIADRSSVRRRWLDKLQCWQRAYQTKIFDERREVYGRGPTRVASVEEADRRWVAEQGGEGSKSV